MYNTVFLTMNIRCWKLVEDKKNTFKTLICKVYFSCLILHNCFTTQDTKKHKVSQTSLFPDKFGFRKYPRILTSLLK